MSSPRPLENPWKMPLFYNGQIARCRVVEVTVTGFLEFVLDGANATQVATAIRITIVPLDG